MRNCVKFLAPLLALAAAGIGAAAQDIQVESSSPVKSPDGRFAVIVDRLLPVVDGQPERYSGRMVVRISAGDTSAPVKQRFIEATQVRTLDQPAWLEGSPWCAVVYNVAKNASGIVYMNAESGRAIQIELVAPTRRMGATQTLEQEVTSLEISDHATRILRTHNIPQHGGSAFPLVLKKLPAFEGKPFGLASLNEIVAALEAYHKFLAQLGAESLEMEQAAESFSADGKRVALLACAGEQQYLVIAPAAAESPEAAFKDVKTVKLDASLKLSCRLAMQQNGDSGDAENAAASGDFRYVTSWQDDNTVAIQREVFGSEDDEPKRELIYSVSAAGEVLKFTKPAELPQQTAPATDPGTAVPVPAAEKPAPKSSPTAAPRGEIVPSDAPDGSARASVDEPGSPESAPKGRAKLSVKTKDDSLPSEQSKPVTSAAQRPEPDERSDEPATRVHEVQSPAAARIAEPPPAPVATPGKPGLLRRLIPVRSRPAPAAPPVASPKQVQPAEAQGTPSD